MTPYEYVLRSHPGDPELSFHTVWLYGWSNDAAFQVMMVLGWKNMYQRCLCLMTESEKDYRNDWYLVWKKDAARYGQKYLAGLKKLEGMQ